MVGELDGLTCVTNEILMLLKLPSEFHPVLEYLVTFGTMYDSQSYSFDEWFAQPSLFFELISLTRIELPNPKAPLPQVSSLLKFILTLLELE